MADVESASHSSSQSFPAGVGFSSIGAVSSAMVQETPTHSRSLRHYASTPLQKGYEREMSNTDISNDSNSNGGEDINIEASLPADHRSGVLPHQPVNRVTQSPEYTGPGIPKSSSTTRMPFIRRQKRAESSFGRGKKPGREVDPFGDEIEDSREKHFEDTSTSYGFDANSTANSKSYSQRRTIDEDGDTMADASVMTAAPPEAALKKRPTRIERNITEQIAWLRRKFDLDQSEELLDSCSAALVQKIMLQGRLYIMTSCICFYAKIFGRVTKEQWSYSAIVSVRKRGGFFANSIKILFNGEVQPVILASLNRREQTLALILTRLSVFSPSAELRSRRNSDSEDHSADDVYSRDPNQAFPRCRSDRSNSSSQQPSLSDNAPSRNSADGNTPFRYARAGSDTASEDISHASSNAVENGYVRSKPPNAEVRGGVSDSIQARLDQLVWAKPGDPMDHVVGKEYEKRTEQARGVLEAPVCVAFNEILFTDFFEKYHEDINNIDVQPTEWTKDGDGIMTREVSFRRPLAFRIGPKETRVKETQRFCYTSDGGVLMETKAHNLDVPYADYFVVETFFEFKPLKNGLACELKASVAVHFAKSTMLRSKIESGTLSETKITFGRLVEMADAHVRDPAVKRLSDAYLKSKQKKKKGRPRGTKPAPRPPPQTTNIEAQATSKPHRNSTASKSEKQDADQTANEPAANATQPVVITNRSLPASDRTFAAARENQSSEILRIVVVIALVTACILLFMALLSFHRMQHKIEGLEAFVREVQKANAARAEATTCAK